MLSIQFSRKIRSLYSWYHMYGIFPNQEKIVDLLGFTTLKKSKTFFNLLIAGRFIVLGDDGWHPTKKMIGISGIENQNTYSSMNTLHHIH